MKPQERIAATLAERAALDAQEEEFKRRFARAIKCLSPRIPSRLEEQIRAEMRIEQERAEEVACRHAAWGRRVERKAKAPDHESGASAHPPTT